MENEYVDHYVRLDDMMELRMKIPVRLDVLELKALMHKTDKLFKLSEVPIVVAKRPKVNEYYTKDALIDLINLKKRNIGAREIAEFMNDKYSHLGMRMTAQKVHGKFHYHKTRDIDKYYDKDYEVPSEFRVKKSERKATAQRSVFSDEITERISELMDEGKTTAKPIKEIVNSEFGTSFTNRQITDKTKYMKMKTQKRALFPPYIELLIRQMSNDGMKPTEVRDKLNREHGTKYSKKQVIGKIYSMRKKENENN